MIAYIAIAIQEGSHEDAKFDAPCPNGHGDEAEGYNGARGHGDDGLAGGAAFFHRIAVDQAFPLELKVPNAQTRRAMAESEEMMRAGTARFASADEMFAELEETGGR